MDMQFFQLSALNISAWNWDKLTEQVLQKGLYTLEVLVIAKIAYEIIIYLLRRVLVNRNGKRILNEQKANTLFPLLRSVFFYVITFTVIVNLLKNVFGLDTGTLLASAGVLGVALGFGSQSLVKDIIGGFFILFENQFGVGEYIKVGEFSGTVEEIGLRATRLRDWGGELHIVPNGSITTVTNYNRGKMRALVDIKIPYSEDLDKAITVMQGVCEKVGELFREKMVDLPVVQGVIQFGEFSAVVRVVAYTLPNEQWGVEREIRRRIYKAFNEAGIHIPQAHVIMEREKS